MLKRILSHQGIASVKFKTDTIPSRYSIRNLVFATDDIRWAPPCPIDGKPMRRADLRAAEKIDTSRQWQ
jgi:hypothetical protein